MLTVTQIQASMDDIARRMAEKGLIAPEAEYQIVSNKKVCIILGWRKVEARHEYDLDHHWINEAADLISAAIAWVDALPTPEDRHRDAFLKLAGAAADYAAEHMPADPIACEVRSSIVAGMQRISENILPNHGAA